MPEGDVVYRTANRLRQALAGRVLLHSDFRWPSLADVTCVDRTCLDVLSRGKHILIRFDSRLHPTDPHHRIPITVHSHLRMEGSWRIHATNQPDSFHARSRGSGGTRAILANHEWTAIGHKLGMLNVVPTADEASLIGHLGPDLLGPDWSPTQAIANLTRDSQRHIGDALLDQRNLAGIGTYFMSEALFILGLSPWTPVADVPDLARLIQLERVLLQQNATRAIQATTGSLRTGETSYVHGRSGKPCRRCAGLVRVAYIGEPTVARTAFYCPACQPGPTPTDDGAAQRPLGSSPRFGRRRGGAAHYQRRR